MAYDSQKWRAALRNALTTNTTAAEINNEGTRYRGGVVSYATRFHFTTDRLDSCRYYRDITKSVAGSECRSRRVELNRRADGSRWIPIEWSRARDVIYVPRALAPRFARWFDEGRLPEATGVAFVQEPLLGDGLDVVHESLLWKGRTLLHASSRTGRDRSSCRKTGRRRYARLRSRAAPCSRCMACTGARLPAACTQPPARPSCCEAARTGRSARSSMRRSPPERARGTLNHAQATARHRALQAGRHAEAVFQAREKVYGRVRQLDLLDDGAVRTSEQPVDPAEPDRSAQP